ncbi:MAG: tetratricopeptide repeat protein [Acidobacteriaceae bacterium]|nr:tetratricopeptide repeat protein [Acidobacteriaceae bacterium]
MKDQETACKETIKNKDFAGASNHLQVLLKYSPKAKQLRIDNVRIMIELAQYDEAHSELMQLQGICSLTDLLYLKAYLTHAQGNSYSGTYSLLLIVMWL